MLFCGRIGCNNPVGHHSNYRFLGQRFCSRSCRERVVRLAPTVPEMARDHPVPKEHIILHGGSPRPRH